MNNSPSIRLKVFKWLPLWAVIFVLGILFLGGCADPSQPAAKFVRRIDWIGSGSWVKVDTHIHTTFSDGANSISEVAFQASRRGCDAIAITDHADGDLQAATPEYADAIRAARREHPGLIIIAGLEWNIPPYAGDEHATVLVPPGPQEFDTLAEFKSRFDDLDREPHDEKLAAAALRWLDQQKTPGDARPLVIYNHPNRKTSEAAETVKRIEAWRTVNDLVIGFSGAPGHQRGREQGAYSGAVKLMDGWDPAAAEVGGAWDSLLAEGFDVWAARAPSDFHNSTATNVADYWPGEFSETWLYVPERTAEGVLRAFRAGSFFAAHGRIARRVELTVAANGLNRPAHAGEVIEVPAATQITIELHAEVPKSDWEGTGNRIDVVELIVVGEEGTRVIPHKISDEGLLTVSETIEIGESELAIRARGRRKIADGPDLLFYTNAIRIIGSMPEESLGASNFRIDPLMIRRLAGLALLLLGGLALLVRLKSAGKLTSRSGRSSKPVPDATLISDPPVAHCARPWDRLDVALHIGYWILATTAAIWVSWSATTVSAVELTGVVTHVESGWTPTLGLILVLTTGMFALLAVPAYPLTGILVYVALVHGVPRYSPALQYFYEFNIPEWICGLTLIGSVVSLVRRRAIGRIPSLPLAIMAAGLVIWALVSAISAGVAAGGWDFETKHHPVHFLNALTMFAVASLFSVSRRDILLLTLFLAGTLLLRSSLFPESIWLDGDLGHLIAMALPLILMAIVSSQRLVVRLGSAFLAVGLAWVLFLTESRGAAIGAVLALTALWALSRHRWKTLAIVAPMLVLGVFAFQSTTYWQRFADLWQDGPAKESADSRITLWTAAQKVWFDHPVLGVGPGNFPRIVDDYISPTGSGNTFHGYAAHGNLQSVLAELGTVGGLFYVAFFGTVLVSLSKIGRYASHAWPAPEARGIAASLVGYCGSGIFISRHDQLLPYILAGSAAALIQQTRSYRRILSPLQQPNSAHRPTPELQAVPRRSHFGILSIAFICLAIYGSLVPFEFRPLSFDKAVEHFRAIRFLHLSLGQRADWVANILLFVPIGFCTLAAVVVDRPRHWKHVVWWSIVAVCCFALSVVIEFTQLWFPPRTVSQNDVVAETIGGACGAAICLLLGQTIADWIRCFTRDARPLQRREWILQAYLIGLLIYSIMPLDLTISPAEIYQKFQEGRIELVPFSVRHATIAHAIYQWATDVLVFIPVGFYATTAWTSSQRPVRSWPNALVSGVLVVAAIEFSQLIVFSRHSSTTDVILGTLGVAVGIGIFRCGLLPLPAAATSNQQPVATRGGLVYWILAALYSVGIILLFWAPFDFTEDVPLIRSKLDGFLVAPFSRLYWGSELHALVHILRRILWFVPIGVLLALGIPRVTEVRRFQWLACGAACLGVATLATVVELGQIFLPDRYADITDVLLSTVGGVAGLVVTLKVIGSRTDFTATQKQTATAAVLRQPQLGTPPSTSGRIPGLTGLRALACLAVFGVHFQEMAGLELSVGPFNISQFFEEGRMGVALLFVLSGFLLSLPLWSKSPENRDAANLGRFVRQRLSRILPAYFLCLTVLVIYKQHWQSGRELFDTLAHYFFLHNFANFSFWGISEPFWALAPLMQFYLLFGLIIWSLGRIQMLTHRSLLIVFSVICVGSFLTHTVIVELAVDATVWPFNRNIISPDGPVITRSVLAHLPIFFAGALSSWLFVRGGAFVPKAFRRRPWLCDVVWITAALLLFIGLSTPLHRALALPGGRYLFPSATILLLTLILTAPRAPIVRSVLEYSPIRGIGNISYGIYVYHLSCLIVVSQLIQLSGGEVGQHPVVLGLFGLALTIIVATCSYLFLEQPIMRAIRKRATPFTGSRSSVATPADSHYSSG